jgi:protein TonB
MLGSKLDIFKTEWLDVVFAGRNKAYGAYVLRKVGPSMTAKSLFIGVAVFVLAVSTPLIVKFLDKGDKNANLDRIIET